MISFQRKKNFKGRNPSNPGLASVSRPKAFICTQPSTILSVCEHIALKYSREHQNLF